ncbi:thioredoxin family protein [Halogeometricum sp. S1BR25-6]|uniref:Thioredoxin family protein n=1 Tax=Halogeometricum salsisoli TaxID=2950536 RepID=A0ABU2GBN7_9EURY|nr:thioredoxin family protein [Halogeometricum sp. S1BR25-6]MDS0298217.1 thioredoxin family protein [Halogeometricum sp. S1BR25-6]
MSADAPANGRADPEAALDRLLELGAVTEDADGTLATTAAFENDRRIYRDTYDYMGREGVADTVADLFGVDRDEAHSLLDSGEVTTEDVVAYLAVRSFADEPLGTAEHAMMAELLVRIGPGTPVPDVIEVVDDATYEAFLAEHPDAVVTVWKHHCDPCEAMKGDLDAILDAVPDGVAVAGVDGAEADAFRRAFGVDAAPAVLCFRDGVLEALETGRKRPAELATLFETVWTSA